MRVPPSSCCWALQPTDNAARKTKIVCTLGPSCWSEEGLAALIDAGMNVARFNFSHGDHAGHGEVLERVRKVSYPARWQGKQGGRGWQAGEPKVVRHAGDCSGVWPG
jgi:hypothetical protein